VLVFDVQDTISCPKLVPLLLFLLLDENLEEKGKAEQKENNYFLENCRFWTHFVIIKSSSETSLNGKCKARNYHHVH
jgi:hypothetical protein